MKLINQLQRYYHTVKYFRLRQITSRFRFLLRRPFYRRFARLVNRFYDGKTHHVSTKSARLLKGLDKCSRLFLSDETSKAYEKIAKALLSNTFNFLNTEIRFDSLIDWQAPQVPNLGISLCSISKLWRYNLHYFDYARDLGSFYLSSNVIASPDKIETKQSDAWIECEAYRNQAYKKFKSLVQDWIEQNTIGQSEGWEAYPTSLRMVNWIFAFHIFAKEIELSPEFHEQLLRSLFKHALFLERNLEYHICGNHLIKNGKALTFAGLFFKGRESYRWYKKGTSLLWKELQEQILDDGGHFELSPMYHCIVLEDLLDIYNLIKHNKISTQYKKNCKNNISNDQEPFFLLLRSKINQMLDWLANIVDGKGKIPLLNDSALSIAPEFSDLCAYAEKLGFSRPKRKEDQVVFLRDSGYCILQNKNFCVLFDCGKIGTSYLPGHAHCDMLSFVMYYKGIPVIVDTGVYEYNEGERRDYCRSTKAHNTVMINGQEQAEIWKSFRVGYRGYPIEQQIGENWIRCGHSGYERIKRGLRHFRKIAIFDSAVVISDDIEGTASQKSEGFLHFAPNVNIQRQNGGLRAKIEGHELNLEFDGASFELFESEYFPEFGKIEKRQSVRLFYNSDNVRIEFKI